MEPSEWMGVFRELHTRLKADQLTPKERERYLSMREELARSLAAAQGLTVPEGQNARRYFRVAQVFRVELNNLSTAMTRDVSRSGFSATVPGTFAENAALSFAITLGRGQDPITGQGHVVTSLKQQGNSKISVAIDVLNDANAERLEVALFDSVLARFKA
jgi:hypothetical protein